ncbi:MAG TPA: ShlB/FhaC/HecB family hemolysin secretion/activation protein [Sphingomicrobium sp.]|nr:ShlB/FhaC/HecB family hemolysin secretion/activation protein [Sphingomicrobium sp.]
MPLGVGRQFKRSVQLLAGCAALLPCSAGAQTVAPTRDELTRPQQVTSPRSTLNVSGGIERSPCPLSQPQYADVRITIRNVKFNNLKGASAEELAPAWRQFAGTSQSVAVLCEIRDAAATILRDKGYLAAVQVPTQRIDDGVVQMETLFARVTTVRARGQTGGAEAKLAGYLSKLTEDEIFDRYRAERYLLLARDLPGYNVQLTLRPAGTGPGELIGEVSVVKLPALVDVMVQNLAAPETGRWGGQVRAQLFGLTGLGDVTSASFYSTAEPREQKILQLSHSFRPGSEGFVVDGNFTYAWTRPDLNADSVVPPLKARTLFAELAARYPVVRRQSHNLWIGAGFDFLKQDVDFFGPQSRDHLRVGFIRANFDAVDLTSRRPAWRGSLTVELRHGFDVLGASNGCPTGGCPVGTTGPSRSDGDPTGTLLRVAGDSEVAIGRNVALAVSPRAQLGFDPLFAFEEFTAGNYTIGRGYDPAVLSGDSGVGASVELRGPRYIPRKLDTVSMQPYLFGDAAWVWNKGVDQKNDKLQSVGGGVRVTWSDRLRLDAAVAKPLSHTGVDDKKGPTRFLITLTSRILPWR